MDPIAPGIQEMNDLQGAGFTPTEIDEWRANTTRDLQDAGFSPKEVGEYFGDKEPDMTPVKQMYEANIDKRMNEQTAKPGGAQPPVAVHPEMQEAKGFLDAVEAGFDMSVTGLLRERPDVVLPENAPMYMRIASQVGTLAGDVPAMVAGAFAGGAVGTAAGGAVGTVALPVVGTVGGAAAGGVIGAGAGAFALPEGMRTHLMQGYEKGDVKDFRDFWERAAAVAISSGKGAIIGGVTAGAGALVGKVGAGIVAPQAIKTTARLSAEVATMTTIGAALEGHAPSPQDFIDGAILVGGMHGVVKVASKARGIYAKTGVKPEEIALKAKEDPHFKQQLLSENNEVPIGGEFGDRAYHGTFENFSPEAIRPSSKGRYGEGFYVTTDKTGALNYGDKVLEFNIRANNLFDVTGEKPSPQLTGFAEKHGLALDPAKSAPVYEQLIGEVRKKFPDENLVGTAARDKLNEMIKAEGFDGVRFEQNGSNNNAVIFDRNNLKTVTEMAESGEPQFSTSKPLKEINPEHSEAVNKILGKVGEVKEPTAGEKVVKAVKEVNTSKIYTAIVDRLDPINQATKALVKNVKELAADLNPYILARTAVDYKAKAKHFFEKGVIDYKTKEIRGESLRSTLEKVESIEKLEAYMISKRAVEKESQGFKSGMDIEAARQVIKELGPKYEAAAQKVTKFSNDVLDYMVDSGVLSEKQRARFLEANKDYVPFKRIIESEGGDAKAGGKAGSLKKFKGSDADIQSPIISIVENTIELLKMAEVNRPKRALIELAAKTEGQTLITKVPDKLQAIEVKASEIVRALEDQGAITTLESIKRDLKEKGLPVTDEMIAKSFEKENVFQAEAIRDMVIFRKEQMDLTPRQFAVYEKGKRTVYETTPELAEAFKKLDGDTTSMNLAFKVMRGFTTVKKFALTFTPEFIVKNQIRDWITGSTFTKGKGINPIDVVVAMKDIWTKNDHYYNWLKSGGANGAFLEMGERYIKNDIYKLQKQTNMFNSVKNTLQKPVDVMRLAAELSEQSLRVAEFKKVRKAGGSYTEAGFAAREITLDFQRVGAKMSALNSITAFLNVSIQGLDRTARAFKEDPAGTAGRSMMYITAPSVLLWWANKDDERYKEIPRWEKDHFWIIPTDNWQEVRPEEADNLPEYMVRVEGDKVFVNKGVIYRIPKPQELGLIFGSIPERVLEKYFADNPNAMKEFDKSMMDLVTPSFVPDAVAPAIEQYFNKSFFTGRDIVPHHLKDIQPEYQFVEYTSETAKTLGKMVASVDRDTQMASPVVIQNYIRSWGGSLGQYAVQVADKALEKSGIVPDIPEASDTLSDVPFVKAFVVRFPQANSNSVQDFYDNYDKSNRVFKTIKHLAKEGDYENLEKEMALDANQEYLMQLDGIKEGLAAQAKLIRSINKAEDMSPDEKRQMIDGLYLSMTETAKIGNQMMMDLKKAVGE